MAVNKPELETFIQRKELAKQFASATNAFATNHESDVAVPTRPDIRIRTQNGGQQIGSGRNSSTERVGEAIPTATQPVFTILNKNMTLPSQPGIETKNGGQHTGSGNKS